MRHRFWDLVLNTFFLFMFHVDLMSIILGFQEFHDLKDGCSLVFPIVLLWLCRISDRNN